MIERLRTEGLSVVQLLGQDDLSSVRNATHQLVQVAGHWNLEKI